VSFKNSEDENKIEQITKTRGQLSMYYEMWKNGEAMGLPEPELEVLREEYFKLTRAQISNANTST
jgi:hypothetical protein